MLSRVTIERKEPLRFKRADYWDPLYTDAEEDSDDEDEDSLGELDLEAKH